MRRWLHEVFLVFGTGARHAVRASRPHCAGPSGFLAVLASGGVRANSLRSNMRGPDPLVAPLLGGASTAGPTHTARRRGQEGLHFQRAQLMQINPARRHRRPLLARVNFLGSPEA